MNDERPLDERPAARPTVPAPASSDEPEPPKKRGPGCCGIGCLAIIVLAVAVWLIGAVQGSSGDRGDAEVVTCQNLVKDNLSSPSTADFVGVPSYSGGVIRGEVDAQNGFGATVRSAFQCTDTGDGRVRLDYLE